jgi:H+/Cl- antiporter ClcA
VSFAIDKFVEVAFILRLEVVARISAVPLQYIAWLAISLVLAGIAFVITKYAGPNAAGSGLPEVKVILSGIDMPQHLSLRTLVGKVLGLALVLAAGLFASKQSPMLHIGAMIAVQLARLPPFKFLYESPDLRAQITTAGTACGLSSHFGTPIAGLLFTVEVTPSYFNVRSYWLASLSSVLAALVFRVFYNLNIANTSNIFSPPFAGLISSDHSPSRDFTLIGVSVAMGVICGLLSIVFANLTKVFFILRRRFSNVFIYRYPVIYLFIITIVTLVLVMPQTFGSYISQSVFPTLHFLFSGESPSSSPSSSSSSSTAIYWGRWHPTVNLLVMFIVRFILTAATGPCPIPCGLYATNLLIGTIFGRIVGDVLVLLGVPVFANAIAMVGGAAYVGALTHTFSSALVLIEMTGSTDNYLPTILATVVSIFVARLLSESIFEKIIRVRSLPYMFDFRHSPEPRIASDIMTTDFAVIPQYPTIAELQQALKASTCSVFAVINPQNEHLLGTFERTEAMELLTEMTRNEAAKIQLKYVPTPVTILETTPLKQLHLFFITMRLRFAFVTRDGIPVGLILRGSFSNALEEQVHLI